MIKGQEQKQQESSNTGQSGGGLTFHAYQEVAGNELKNTFHYILYSMYSQISINGSQFNIFFTADQYFTK